MNTDEIELQTMNGPVFDPITGEKITSVDKELDANAYIVPGLGDAGDLAFGTKT